MDNATALELVQRMFAAEFELMASQTRELSALALGFHPDVVVHEPASLPYAGDWRGLDGVAALIGRMGETWADMKVEDVTVAAAGDVVLLSCKLDLTSRASGRTLTQPFAEVLRFRDGRLVEGTPFYFDTAALLEALRP
jgi:ketosteroid isomerase-like protein